MWQRSASECTLVVVSLTTELARCIVLRHTVSVRFSALSARNVGDSRGAPRGELRDYRAAGALACSRALGMDMLFDHYTGSEAHCRQLLDTSKLFAIFNKNNYYIIIKLLQLYNIYQRILNNCSVPNRISILCATGMHILGYAP